MRTNGKCNQREERFFDCLIGKINFESDYKINCTNTDANKRYVLKNDEGI
jgi:hypothetical protein